MRSRREGDRDCAGHAFGPAIAAVLMNDGAAILSVDQERWARDEILAVEPGLLVHCGGARSTRCSQRSATSPSLPTSDLVAHQPALPNWPGPAAQRSRVRRGGGQWTAWVFEAARHAAPPLPRPVGLTEREVDVVALLARLQTSRRLGYCVSPPRLHIAMYRMRTPRSVHRRVPAHRPWMRRWDAAAAAGARRDRVALEHRSKAM